MKYITLAVFLVLTVTYTTQGVHANSTQTPDIIGNQNSTNPTLTRSEIISTVHDVTQKPQLSVTTVKIAAKKNDTKIVSNSESNTEAPVIINDSTYSLPGTQIDGDNTTLPPVTTSTVQPTIPSTSKSTIPPTTRSTAEPVTPLPSPHRGFDGPSFVGGIVLALGLVAIGFVAFKFYKARTELNYHTL